MDSAFEIEVPSATRNRSTSVPAQRLRYKKEQWEAHRPLIERLYIHEKATLQDIKTTLEDKHDFRPAVRTYKAKIQEWGLEKNVKAADMRLIHAKAEKRKLETGKNTEFVVKKHTVTTEQFQRFKKRKPPNESENVPSPSGATPPYISYRTPGPSPASPPSTTTSKAVSTSNEEINTVSPRDLILSPPDMWSLPVPTWTARAFDSYTFIMHNATRYFRNMVPELVASDDALLHSVLAWSAAQKAKQGERVTESQAMLFHKSYALNLLISRLRHPITLRNRTPFFGIVSCLAVLELHHGDPHSRVRSYEMHMTGLEYLIGLLGPLYTLPKTSSSSVEGELATALLADFLGAFQMFINKYLLRPSHNPRVHRRQTAEADVLLTSWKAEVRRREIWYGYSHVAKLPKV